MIAAAHKSSGKTTISLGLAASLKNIELKVQTFKKGPDYIDPMWLSTASGQACYNLDFNALSNEEIIDLYAQKSTNSDICIVEANKGLYDGLALDGSDSNASLAKLLNIPVILVIDSMGMTRGIAPLLLGYQEFDKDVNIAGIILNKVGGKRHEEKLRLAIKAFTNIKVLGAIWRSPEFEIGERHLGLKTPFEDLELENKINNIAKIIDKEIDIDKLLSIAKSSAKIKAKPNPQITRNAQGLKIGIIRDEAFGFYYADDLEAFEKAGAKLIYINSINDRSLPKIDGLFIGGGFPEIHSKALEDNFSLRKEIKQAIENGLPTYAECAGLIYLCNEIEWQDKIHKMVGIIDATALMHDRPQGRGYVKYQALPSSVWGKTEIEIKAHEFHYTSLKNLTPSSKFTRKITRGHGIDGTHDGIIYKNLIAGFCHLRNSQSNDWINQFLNFVKSKKLNLPA